jgi:hypothetical protein
MRSLIPDSDGGRTLPGCDFFLPSAAFSRLRAFKKYCGHAVGKDENAVFLGLSFVSAQSQAARGHAPSPKPRSNPKILAPRGYSIF